MRRKDSYRYNLSKDLDSIYPTNSVTNFHKKTKADPSHTLNPPKLNTKRDIDHYKYLIRISKKIKSDQSHKVF